MLFEGIPEAKRQRFDNFVVEQTLRTGDDDHEDGDGEHGTEITVYTNTNHELKLCQSIYSSWKQNAGCDMVVFVRLGCTKEECRKEFPTLPIRFHSDDLAHIRVHSVVLLSQSPLVRSLLGHLRSFERKQKRASNKKKESDKEKDAIKKTGKEEDKGSISSNGSPVPGTKRARSSSGESFGSGHERDMPEGTSLVPAEILSRNDELKFNGVTCFALKSSFIEGAAFIRVVQYMYSGRLILSDANISETLRACHFLGVESAIELCVEYLLQKLEPCNALSICALANLFNCGRLEELSDDYLSEHFMEVTNEAEWLELASDAVIRLLKRDNLKCGSEASVVQALFRWTRGGKLEPIDVNPSTKALIERYGICTSGFATDDDPDKSKMQAVKTTINTTQKKIPTPNSAASKDSSKKTANTPTSAGGAANSKNKKKKHDEENDMVDGDADDEGDNMDEDEDSDDEEDDDDDEEEEENRAEAFLKILVNGCIRFAHLSDEEVNQLTMEVKDNGILYEIWNEVIRLEKDKRNRVQEDMETGEDSDSEGAVPNLRRYETVRGAQVVNSNCAVLEGHTGYVYAVCEGPKGLICSGSRDQTIRVWDANTLKTVDILEGHHERIFGLVYLSNGKLASCSFDLTLRIWNPEKNWECEQVLEGHTGWVVAVAQVGNHLVSGAADNKIKIWNIDTWKCEHTLESHTDHVYGVCRIVDPDTKEEFLVSASQDKLVKIYSPKRTFAEIASMKGHKDSIRSIKQCDNLLASASADRTIRLWHCFGEKIGKPAGILIGHSDVVETLVSIPNNQKPNGSSLLASASRDCCIKLWDTNAKYCVRTLVGHRNWVKSLYVLSNGKLASASADGTVRVWDI